MDAFGNITGESYGNGGETARGCDAYTGRLTSNTNTRTNNDDLTETFSYDDVGRLTSAGTALGGRDLTFTYDDHGNLLSKLSDIGGDLDVTSYSYPATTPAKPHRLSTVSIGGISNTLSYDSAGNITQYNAASGDDTFIGYDKASRVTKITVGSSSTDMTPTARDEFWYGPDGQRYLRKASWMDSSTLKSSWALYLMGGVFEEVHPEHDATVTYRQRVLVTSNVQHQYVQYPSSSATALEYLHRDHLGSVVTLTNAAGSVLSNGNLDFDPFGRQRGNDWNRDLSGAERDAYAAAEDTRTGRGFTDHEMLNRTGFVHMNGRVYDPRIGRFVQPDPVVGRPALSQNYNRYAYVFNSPLSSTDPTGFDCPGSEPCGDNTSGPSLGDPPVFDPNGGDRCLELGPNLGICNEELDELQDFLDELSEEYTVDADSLTVPGTAFMDRSIEFGAEQFDRNSGVVGVSGVDQTDYLFITSIGLSGTGAALGVAEYGLAYPSGKRHVLFRQRVGGGEKLTLRLPTNIASRLSIPAIEWAGRFRQGGRLAWGAGVLISTGTGTAKAVNGDYVGALSDLTDAGLGSLATWGGPLGFAVGTSAFGFKLAAPEAGRQFAELATSGYPLIFY